MVGGLVTSEQQKKSSLTPQCGASASLFAPFQAIGCGQTESEKRPLLEPKSQFHGHGCDVQHPPFLSFYTFKRPKGASRPQLQLPSVPTRFGLCGQTGTENRPSLGLHSPTVKSEGGFGVWRVHCPTFGFRHPSGWLKGPSPQWSRAALTMCQLLSR